MPPNEHMQQEALHSAHIEIAVLKNVAENQARQLDELTTSMKELTAKVDTISATLLEAKGGWRALMMLGGAGGVVGAAIHWAVNHISLKGTP